MADEVVKLIKVPVKMSAMERMRQDNEAMNAAMEPLRKTLSGLPFSKIPAKGFFQISDEFVALQGTLNERIGEMRKNFEAINLIVDPLQKTLSSLPFDQIPAKNFVQIPDETIIQLNFINEHTRKMVKSVAQSLSDIPSIQQNYKNAWEQYESVFAEPLPMVQAAQVFRENRGLLSIGSGIPMTETAEKELVEALKVDYADAVIIKNDQQKLELKTSVDAEPISLPTAADQAGINRFLPNFGKSELHNFIDHLKQFPMLALEDKAGTGRKILDAIQNMVPEVETRIQATMYRARKMKRSKEEKDLPLIDLPRRLLNLKDMYGPPTGISGQGRFNFTGQSVMYTCSNEYATLQEIRAGVDDFGTIYQFHIDRTFTMLDMTDDHPLFAYCMQKVEDESSSQKVRHEYFLPNFIAECCRFVDIDVIRYRSVQHEDTINYVFFGFPEHHLKGTEAGSFIIEKSDPIFDWS